MKGTSFVTFPQHSSSSTWVSSVCFQTHPFHPFSVSSPCECLCDSHSWAKLFYTWYKHMTWAMLAVERTYYSACTVLYLCHNPEWAVGFWANSRRRWETAAHLLRLWSAHSELHILVSTQSTWNLTWGGTKKYCAPSSMMEMQRFGSSCAETV